MSPPSSLPQATPVHFLLQPRPVLVEGILVGETDTTTLDAHDFDVSVHTGFMPPVQPLKRLPAPWDIWELMLDRAIVSKLTLGDEPTAPPITRSISQLWRDDLAKLALVDLAPLSSSETRLRRAHLVLAFLLHFYIHSIPPDLFASSITIPRALTIPLLIVSAHLQLPPILTYSDTVLYNWGLLRPNHPISESNIRILTTLTGTEDEAHFYLTSAKIELRGVKALDLMRSSMNEAFVGDATAVRRINIYLDQLADVISQLTTLLSTVRENCRPVTFYQVIRPWLRGIDAVDSSSRYVSWSFEGAEELQLSQPEELSGPSAGQSSLIYALDIFLGMEFSDSSQQQPKRHGAFLERMMLYMPRHHRAFLTHLAHSRPTIRSLVLESNDKLLKSAYNNAISALKLFRNEHIRIVALYIIAQRGQSLPDTSTKGTGGTEAMPFLKDIRDLTASYLI